MIYENYYIRSLNDIIFVSTIKYYPSYYGYNISLISGDSFMISDNDKNVVIKKRDKLLKILEQKNREQKLNRILK